MIISCSGLKILYGITFGDFPGYDSADQGAHSGAGHAAPPRGFRVGGHSAPVDLILDVQGQGEPVEAALCLTSAEVNGVSP